MKEIILMYSPTILTFVLALFNVIKTIKGLNVVDPQPHIKSLENRLDIKYENLLEKIEAQEKANELLSEQLELEKERCNAFETLIVEIDQNIKDKFERQNEMLTKIVREDVEIKADLRRADNDSQGV